jgi:hypothetical protein
MHACGRAAKRAAHRAEARRVHAPYVASAPAVLRPVDRLWGAAYALPGEIVKLPRPG